VWVGRGRQSGGGARNAAHGAGWRARWERARGRGRVHPRRADGVRTAARGGGPCSHSGRGVPRCPAARGEPAAGIPAVYPLLDRLGRLIAGRLAGGAPPRRRAQQDLAGKAGLGRRVRVPRPRGEVGEGRGFRLRAFPAPDCLPTTAMAVADEAVHHAVPVRELGDMGGGVQSRRLEDFAGSRSSCGRADVGGSLSKDQRR
jgi:hypothetical protein